MYQAYITKIENISPVPNADRLVVGYCFGNPVVFSKEMPTDVPYIYFPTGGQLSEEYCAANNLVRKKDENGNNIGGYLDPDKRNIRALKLRQQRSDGLIMPLSSLSSFGDYTTLKVGDIINDSFNNHLICQKYIPKVQIKEPTVHIPTKKVKVAVAPLFQEHIETQQLAYNMGAFQKGDQIEITLKMHGSSQRTGYLPVIKRYKRNLWDRICRRVGKPVYEWDYISGTRHTVLKTFDGSFYGSNKFRQQHHDCFVGKLMKGETVYYEVVGYQECGTPIMGSCNNKKMGTDYVKQYGQETVFSYGCDVGQSKLYVYRMTLTNEDGYVVEYSPDYMRYRCNQIGVSCVPVFWKGYLTEQNNIKDLAEQYYDGPDPIDKTHIREGVVCRIVNRPVFTAYKHKNYNFKMLSGIIIDNGNLDNMTTDQLGEL